MKYCILGPAGQLPQDPSPRKCQKLRLVALKSSTWETFNRATFSSRICGCILAIILTLYVSISYSANWVEIREMKYHKGSVIVHQHCLFPVFLMIEDMLILPNTDVVFCCRKIHTLRFWKHVHSYEVMVLNRIVVINYNDLLDYHPLNVYSVVVHDIVKKFVRMRYDLGDAEE